MKIKIENKTVDMTSKELKFTAEVIISMEEAGGRYGFSDDIQRELTHGIVESLSQKFLLEKTDEVMARINLDTIAKNVQLNAMGQLSPNRERSSY